VRRAAVECLSASFRFLSLLLRSYDGDHLRKVLMRARLAAGQKIGATEEEVVASTEIRIASLKPFAPPSEKDDASINKIE
jgi:hypothetical protein